MDGWITHIEYPIIINFFKEKTYGDEINLPIFKSNVFFKTTPKEAPTSGEPIIFLQSTLVACILNLLSGEERLVLMCSSEKSRRFIPVSYRSISLSALEKYQKSFSSRKLCLPLGKMLVNMNCNINLMKKIKQEIDFFVIFKLGPCLAQGKISNYLLNIQ